MMENLNEKPMTATDAAKNEDHGYGSSISPHEIRKRLHEITHRGGRIDGAGDWIRIDTPASRVVRDMMALCQHGGYSGEDTMTLLAYQSLLAYEKLFDEYVALVNRTPKKITIGI